jgi:hypothetical protein
MSSNKDKRIIHCRWLQPTDRHAKSLALAKIIARFLKTHFNLK